MRRDSKIRASCRRLRHKGYKARAPLHKDECSPVENRAVVLEAAQQHQRLQFGVTARSSPGIVLVAFRITTQHGKARCRSAVSGGAACLPATRCCPHRCCTACLHRGIAPRSDSRGRHKAGKGDECCCAPLDLLQVLAVAGQQQRRFVETLLRKVHRQIVLHLNYTYDMLRHKGQCVCARLKFVHVSMC